MGPLRLGTDSEEFIEVGLAKSFASSDGAAGNALTPETEGGTLSKSALTNFGIDRHQLELMGIGEREIQDRIYRTLTMWSSSMHSTLHELANRNPDCTGKLWAVYLRLVEVCNPDSSILTIEQRHQFEANMKKASEDLERTRMKAEDDHRRVVDRLKESERVCAETKKYALTTIPKLKEEVAALQAALEKEKQLGQQRHAEMLIAKQTSNDILSDLEAVETKLQKTEHDLRKTTDQLHVAQTETNRLTNLYNSEHQENERIHNSTKEATSKEQRMRDKLSAASKSKEQSETELERSRKTIIDKQQDLERMKIALREANAVRSSSLHILKDLVVKYRAVTGFLCESDKTQIDFVRENVEHGNVGLQELQHLNVSDNVHALLHLKHHLDKLPEGIMEQGHVDTHDDLSAVQEEQLCDRISVWVESISSHASAVDRHAVRSIVENIEDIFERRMAEFDAMEEALAGSQRQSAASKVMTENWIEQLCDERAVVARLQGDLATRTGELRDTAAEVARLRGSLERMERELEQTKEVASGYTEAVTAMKAAQRGEKEALDKYAHTAALEHQVELLEKEAAGAKDTLRRERDTVHEQHQIVSRQRVEIEKKQKSLDEANAVSISLLAIMNALNEESSAQLQAADASLGCLVDSRPVSAPISSLPLTALHVKLQHAESACEELLDDEKEVVIGVMQHVVDMRSRLEGLVDAGSKAATYRTQSDSSQDEMESLKAWVAKERARFNKNMDECRQQARSDLHHLREEITHLTGQLRRAKEKGEKDHLEKIDLLKSVLELEQRIAQAEKEGFAPVPVPVEEPQQEEQEEQEKLKVENDLPSFDTDDEEEEEPSRPAAPIAAPGAGAGGGSGLSVDVEASGGSEEGNRDRTTSTDSAAGKTLRRSDLVDAVNLQAPSEPSAGPSRSDGGAPGRRGVYYVNPADIRVEEGVIDSAEDGASGLVDMAKLGIAPTSPPAGAKGTPLAEGNTKSFGEGFPLPEITD